MKRPYHLWLLLPAAVLIVFFLFPYAVALSTALKHTGDLYAQPMTWLPPRATLNNFVTVWTRVPLARYLGNSLAIGLAATALTLAAGSASAFALAHLPFRGKFIYLYLVLACQMFSPVVLIIALYRMFSKVGLMDTLLAPIIANTAFMLPPATWLLYNYLLAVPRTITEAARLDGCGPFMTLTRVVLPLTRPGLVATGVFAFIWAWNDFLFALTFLWAPERKTITVGLFSFIAQWTIKWNELLAASLIAVVPVVALFLLFEKHIVHGLTDGGVK